MNNKDLGISHLHSNMLELLRYYNFNEKTEIANRLGISMPTMYKAIDDMYTVGFIKKDGSVIEINKGFGTFVGISIGSALCKIVFLHFDFHTYSNEEFKKYKKHLCLSMNEYIDGDPKFTLSSNSDDNYIYYTTPSSFKSLKDILNCIFDSLKNFMNEDGFNLRSIGISSTGVVNERTQTICKAHNLAYLDDTTLQNLMSPGNSKFFIENNVSISLIQNSNAAVICEKVTLYQSNSQYMSKKNIVSLYLGVGIGAGFILNGMLYSGTNGFAGELGHTNSPYFSEFEQKNKSAILDEMCTCGSKDCFDYKMRTYIFEKNKSDFSDMSSDDIYQYLAKNPLKTKYFGKYLGNIVNTLTSILNIDLVVFTGKFKKCMELLVDHIDSAKDENQLKFSRNDCQITVSELGSRSPTIGAAIYSYYKKYNIPCVWDF